MIPGPSRAGCPFRLSPSSLSAIYAAPLRGVRAPVEELLALFVRLRERLDFSSGRVGLVYRVSYAGLARDLGWTARRVRYLVELLERLGVVVRESTRRWLVLFLPLEERDGPAGAPTRIGGERCASSSARHERDPRKAPGARSAREAPRPSEAPSGPPPPPPGPSLPFPDEDEDDEGPVEPPRPLSTSTAAGSEAGARDPGRSSGSGGPRIGSFPAELPFGSSSRAPARGAALRPFAELASRALSGAVPERAPDRGIAHRELEPPPGRRTEAERARGRAWLDRLARDPNIPEAVARRLRERGRGGE